MILLPCRKKAPRRSPLASRCCPRLSRLVLESQGQYSASHCRCRNTGRRWSHSPGIGCQIQLRRTQTYYAYCPYPIPDSKPEYKNSITADVRDECVYLEVECEWQGEESRQNGRDGMIVRSCQPSPFLHQKKNVNYLSWHEH